MESHMLSHIVYAIRVIMMLKLYSLLSSLLSSPFFFRSYSFCDLFFILHSFPPIIFVLTAPHLTFHFSPFCFLTSNLDS